jgi:hypothetical protein
MIRAIDSQGLEVDLADEYSKVRDGANKAALWDPIYTGPLFNNDSGVDRFLARVQENPARNTALFQMSMGGAEVASRSQAIDPKRGIPAAEKHDLEMCFRDFKRLADDPKADPEFKMLAQSFRLPDPETSPEMYRLYRLGPWYLAPFCRQRLLVLWGCGRRNGPKPIAPLEAVGRLQTDPWDWLKRWVPWVIVLLVLALLVLAASFFVLGRTCQYFDVVPHTAATKQPLDATAKAAGTVDFAGDLTMEIKADETKRFDGFPKRGLYRVTWTPAQGEAKGLHGEHVDVRVADRVDQQGNPVDDLPDARPRANLRLHPAQGEVGKAIEADTSASFAVGNRRIVKREVRWSDDLPFVAIEAGKLSVSHVYDREGTYKATLRVTDSEGMVGEDSAVSRIGAVGSGAATTPSSGTATTPSSGSAATPTGGVTTTPSSGPSVTPTRGTVTTPSSGATTTPGSGVAATPTGSQVTTPTGGVAPTPSSGVAMTQSSGSVTTPTSGVATTPSGGPSITPSSGSATTPTGGPATTPSSGTVTTPTTGVATTPSGGPAMTLTAGPSTTPSSGFAVTPSAGPSVTPTGSPATTPSIGPVVVPAARRSFEIVKSGEEEVGGKIRFSLLVRDSDHPNSRDYDVVDWYVNGAALGKPGSRDVTLERETAEKINVAVEIGYGVGDARVQRRFATAVNIDVKVVGQVQIGPTSEVKP